MVVDIIRILAVGQVELRDGTHGRGTYDDGRSITHDHGAPGPVAHVARGPPFPMQPELPREVLPKRRAHGVEDNRVDAGREVVEHDAHVLEVIPPLGPNDGKVKSEKKPGHVDVIREPADDEYECDDKEVYRHAEPGSVVRIPAPPAMQNCLLSEELLGTERVECRHGERWEKVEDHQLNEVKPLVRKRFVFESTCRIDPRSLDGGGKHVGGDRARDEPDDNADEGSCAHDGDAAHQEWLHDGEVALDADGHEAE